MIYSTNSSVCTNRRKINLRKIHVLKQQEKSQLEGKILQNHLQCGFTRLCVVKDLDVNVLSVISRGTWVYLVHLTG